MKEAENARSELLGWKKDSSIVGLLVGLLVGRQKEK